MAWLISVLGSALALAGGYALWNGISYIRLDWGQTETVAGTVALSAGVVTLALGAVLFALRDLARLAVSRPAGVGIEALTWSEADAPVQPMLSRVRSKLTNVGLPRAPGVEAPGVEAEPPRITPAGPAHERDAPAIRPGSDPTIRDRVPAAAPEAAPLLHDARDDDEPPEATLAPAEAPTVVGRYEANGATYVLFSDGTIEVETETGTHRFASMAELKEHIERQDTV